LLKKCFIKVIKQSIIAEENYTQVNLIRNEHNEQILLKIDLISDIAKYYIYEGDSV